MLTVCKYHVTIAPVDRPDDTKVEIFDTNKDADRFVENLPAHIECVDFKQQEGEVAPDQIVFVNVYTITRHYGGPEEGGWWYNWYHCVEVIPVQNQHAETMREAFHEKYLKSHKHGDIYSVLGGQEVAVYVEEHPKASETKERPYYE